MASCNDPCVSLRLIETDVSNVAAETPWIQTRSVIADHQTAYPADDLVEDGTSYQLASSDSPAAQHRNPYDGLLSVEAGWVTVLPSFRKVLKLYSTATRRRPLTSAKALCGGRKAHWAVASHKHPAGREIVHSVMNKHHSAEIQEACCCHVAYIQDAHFAVNAAAVAAASSDLEVAVSDHS